MLILWFLLFGMGFGLAATVPPGPINTEIARRTLKFGMRFGIAFGLGSIAIENALAILACTGYGVNIDEHRTWMPVLLFVGFMVLTTMGTFSFVQGYRGWQDPSLLRDPSESPGFPPANTRAARGARHEPLLPDDADPEAVAEAELAAKASGAALSAGGSSIGRSFAAGVGMAVISPYTIVFWIVGLPSAAHDALQHPQHIWALLLGIALGTGAWIAGFSALLSMLKRYTASSTWWIVWTDLIGGVMLLGFAALALIKLVQTLVQHRGPPLL